MKRNIEDELEVPDGWKFVERKVDHRRIHETAEARYSFSSVVDIFRKDPQPNWPEWIPSGYFLAEDSDWYVYGGRPEYDKSAWHQLEGTNSYHFRSLCDFLKINLSEVIPSELNAVAPEFSLRRKP